MVIKRSLYAQIKAHLAITDVFTLIIGPRQAGKTTLMNLLKKDLEEKGEKTISLNMDITGHRPYFATHEQLVQAIRLEIGSGKGYVFLDEIQRKEDAGLFLKGLYDMKLPYKFIVSGSGSLELKENIHESLPGRKRMFELHTLSFEEFVDFKTNYQYSDPGKGLIDLTQFFDVHKERSKILLDEYLNYGGYPRVVLSPTDEKKREEMGDIYKSYLERDIEQLLNIQKTDRFTNLVRMVAAQAGNTVNVTELSGSLGVAQETINHYLWYLEKTFILHKVTPFFRNIRSEITKSPIYYFVDLGLKNYSINQFGTAALMTPPPGLLFENFIYNALAEYLGLSAATIHFWRTQEKAEVDFVVDTGLQAIPVEVKYKVIKSDEVTRSFRSFLAKYKPKHAYIIHLGDYKKRVIDETTIHFLPFYNLQAIFKKL